MRYRDLWALDPTGGGVVRWYEPPLTAFNALRGTLGAGVAEVLRRSQRSSKMTQCRISTSILAVMAWAGVCVAMALGEQTRVSVVVGANAPQLERFAASELCGYLNKLYGIKA